MHIIKMQCCGNDFLLLNHKMGMDYRSYAQQLCNRRLGIGADAVIFMKSDPAEMILYKADGSYEHMDGNAIRCFAKYCFDSGLGRKGRLDILTGAGRIEAEEITEKPFSCRINLGKPNYSNGMMGVADEMDCFGRSLQIGNHYITVYSLFLGSVHTVVFTDGMNSDTEQLASEICHHPIYQKLTNVDFCYVVSKDMVKVRTYERGCGFVLASGDGCAASVVVAQKLGLTKCKVKCSLEYGCMEVEITKKGTVLLSGPAEEVYSLEYEEEKITC